MLIANSFGTIKLPEIAGTQEQFVLAGDVIFDRIHGPTGLYLILDGMVETGIEGSGRTVQLVRRNEVIGFGSWRERSPEWARAVYDSRMIVFDKKELSRLITEKAAFRSFVIDQLVDRLARTELHLNRCRSETIAGRLGQTLLELAEPIASTAHAGHRLTPVPHRILASYLGTSREMITVILNRFKRLGLVHYTRREMFINTLALRRYLMPPG